MEAIPHDEPFVFSAGAGGPAVGSGPSGASSLSATMVQETRREIQQLVREIAQLAQAELPGGRFWPDFLDRVVQAMAAEGGLLWHADRSTWDIGGTVGAVPAVVRDSNSAEHIALLWEVAARGTPVLVPPATASPSEEPAAGRSSPSEVLPQNPSESVAALVPLVVEKGEPVVWVLEIFVPPGGSRAAERGLLRFAAQMGDLASEYLRSDRLRRDRRRRRDWDRLNEALPRLHQSLDRRSAQVAVVDAAAEALDALRVSLLEDVGGRPRAVAVSGIDTIDRRAEAVRAMERAAGAAAQAAQPSGGVQWIAAAEFAPPASDDSLTAPDASPTATSVPAGRQVPVQPAADLPYRGCLWIGGARQWMLVVQDASPVEVDADERQRWSALGDHALAALSNADRFSRIPLARALAGVLGGSPGRQRAARLLTLAAAVGLMIAIAWMPVPMVVHAPGRLEPRSVQRIYAPREGVVVEVAVEHGESVRRGDLLVRMVDRELERQLESLLGEQAVLSHRRAELRTQLVRMPGSANPDESQRLQADQSVVENQLAAIALQLDVLRQEQQRLDLYSDRDGQVDAWQAIERWSGRPVARGEILMRVIDPAAGWQVESEIPQDRLDHLIDMTADNPSAVAATVVLRAFPDHPLSGSLAQIGPALDHRGVDGPVALARITLDEVSLPSVQSGAPARIAIRCGDQPLAYVAFQDLYRAVVGWLRMQWG